MKPKEAKQILDKLTAIDQCLDQIYAGDGTKKNPANKSNCLEKPIKDKQQTADWLERSFW